MTKEVYKVSNLSSSGSVSFMVFCKLNDEDLHGLSQFKKRRQIRSNGIPVKIPAQTTMDLVEETGLTVDSIKSSPELIQLLSNGSLKLSEVTVVENIKEEKEKPQPVINKAINKPKKPKKKEEPKKEPKKELDFEKQEVEDKKE